MSLGYQTLLGTSDLEVDSINTFNINTNSITTTTLITSGIYTVNTTMTLTQIQAILDNTDYNHVIFAPGIYNIGCLNIKRDNIVLEGQMCKLYMPNGMNNPNILVGDKTVNPPTLTYKNIVIKNFILDGNKDNQTSEDMTGYIWIKNNCITINYCSNVVVENCTMNNSISGGMTITYNSNNVKFINCSASANFFDGYTAYGSTNVSIVGCYATGHTNGAGASFDTNMQYMTFDGCVFTNNQLGVFARDSYDIVFSGCVISANQIGMFLAGYSDTVSDRGPARWVLTGNTITNNSNFGMYLQSCNYFTITGNVISGNYGDGLSFNNDTPGNVAGTCSYNNVSGNVMTNNGNSGFYNGPFNDYSNGARDNYLSFNVIKNNSGSQQIRGDLTAWSQEDDLQLNSRKLILHNASGNYANINPSGTGNCIFTFPNSTGSNNNILQTDGSGNSSWTHSPTVTDLVVSEAILMRDEGFLAGSGGIYSRRASDLAGGCKISSYDGSVYFKGGTTANTYVVYDYLNRACFRVYSNGSNGIVGVNTGKIEFAMSGGTTYLGSSQTGGSCTFYLPANDGSNNNLLQTDGTGNTSWTSTPTVSNITVGNNIYLTGNGTTAQYGIFSINASSSSGGCMIDSYSGSIYFKGGTSTSTFTIADSSIRTCFRVYNNGSNGTVSVRNGIIGIATSTGSAEISASLSGGSCDFYLPGTNGFSGYLLQTNGAGSTSWTGSPTVDAVILKNSGNTTTLSGGTGTTTFQFPATNGSSNNVLQTNGSGVTSWVSRSSSLITNTIDTDITMGAGVTYYVSLDPITIAGSGSYRVVLTYCLNFDSSAGGGYIDMYTYDTTTSQRVCEINYYAQTGISTCSCTGVTDLTTYTAGTTYTFIMVFTPSMNTKLLSNSGKIQLYQIPA